MEATVTAAPKCSYGNVPKWRRQSVGGARVPILHKMSGCSANRMMRGHCNDHGLYFNNMKVIASSKKCFSFSLADLCHVQEPRSIYRDHISTGKKSTPMIFDLSCVFDRPRTDEMISRLRGIENGGDFVCQPRARSARNLIDLALFLRSPPFTVVIRRKGEKRKNVP